MDLYVSYIEGFSYQLIASSCSETDNEYIDVYVPNNGTYYISISGGNAGNTYDLWWDDVPMNAPNILIDVSKDPLLSTSKHEGFTQFYSYLDPISHINVDSEITKSLLENYDALIIPNSNESYTNAEIQVMEALLGWSLRLWRHPQKVKSSPVS